MNVQQKLTAIGPKPGGGLQFTDDDELNAYLSSANYILILIDWMGEVFHGGTLLGSPVPPTIGSTILIGSQEQLLSGKGKHTTLTKVMDNDGHKVLWFANGESLWYNLPSVWFAGSGTLSADANGVIHHQWSLDANKSIHPLHKGNV
jgi:hypothetical protein